MDKKITGTTTLLGLFGSPVEHSISPVMHNTAFRALGIDCAYLAFDVNTQSIGKAVDAVRTLNMLGANVTMPCKTAVLPYLDKLTPAAEMAGAVNTIINQDGILTGHNTDGEGYMLSLRDAGFDPAGKKIILAGGGGAATAICAQAALDGVKDISIFNRKDEFFPRITEFARQAESATGCNIRVYDLADDVALRSAMAESYLFINCTGAGMGQLRGISVITDVSMFHKELVVGDVIYQPPKTKLLIDAQQAGCRTINGYGMVLFQGVAAFRCWTGQDMPVDLVRKALEEQQK